MSNPYDVSVDPKRCSWPECEVRVEDHPLVSPYGLPWVWCLPHAEVIASTELQAGLTAACSVCGEPTVYWLQRGEFSWTALHRRPLPCFERWVAERWQVGEVVGAYARRAAR